jgi:hypothetical protein
MEWVGLRADKPHLTQTDKLSIKSWKDPDKLPTGLLESDLRIGNLERREAVNHTLPHRLAHRFHERWKALAQAGASMPL